MSALGSHAGFIVAAYAISLLVVLALIGWVHWTHRRVKGEIAALDGRGIRRRSAAGEAPARLPGEIA